MTTGVLISVGYWNNTSWSLATTPHTMFTWRIPVSWTVRLVVSCSSRCAVLINLLNPTHVFSTVGMWFHSKIDNTNFQSCESSRMICWRLGAGCTKFWWCWKTWWVLQRRKRLLWSIHEDGSSSSWQWPCTWGVRVALAACNCLADMGVNQTLCRWSNLWFDCGYLWDKPPQIWRQYVVQGIVWLLSLRKETHFSGLCDANVGVHVAGRSIRNDKWTWVSRVD